MENIKGPYLAYEVMENEISFSISFGYFTLEDNVKDLQLSISILDIALAIGWRF